MLIPALLHALLSLSPGVTAVPGFGGTQPAPHPLVIGHRGASGELPEHTLEAYARAIDQGADYIEPDLVMTRDGQLVARHENEIGGTTDVAERFPERRRSRLIDGQPLDGWFSEDFTLAELRGLRARQRLAFRDQSHNGRYLVPTFDEILALRAQKSRDTGREIGIYIETKHPSHFRSIGLPIEGRMLETLGRHGLLRADAPVFVQSFEVGNLQRLRRMTELRLVQLIEDAGQPADMAGTGLSYASMLTPAGLRQVALYATGIGPYKRLIVPERDGRLLPATSLISDAHAAGLLVHPWTFRTDTSYLAADYKGEPSAEYAQFFSLGVDGVFSDFPADAVRARQAWLTQSNR